MYIIISKSTCSGTVLLIKFISPLHSHCCHLMVKSVLKLIGPPSWNLSRFSCGMKWLGVLPPIMWHEVAGSITPPPLFDRMLVPHIVISQHFIRLPRQFAGNHLHSRVERGIVRVKCLVKEHNTLTQPVLDLRPLHLVSSTLAIILLYLPVSAVVVFLTP